MKSNVEIIFIIQILSIVNFYPRILWTIGDNSLLGISPPTVSVTSTLLEEISCSPIFKCNRCNQASSWAAIIKSHIIRVFAHQHSQVRSHLHIHGSKLHYADHAIGSHLPAENIDHHSGEAVGERGRGGMTSLRGGGPQGRRLTYLHTRLGFERCDVPSF